MGKMIQIRHVPDRIHRVLKKRAADAGMSLSDYLCAEITRVVNRPTLAEILQRLAELPPIETEETAVEAVRREREAR